MSNELLNNIMEPIITYYDLEGLEEGDWIWDNELVERREHGRTLKPEVIREAAGFRQIHILDSNFDSIKPFMLSTIDGYNCSAKWEYFTPYRYWKFKKV